MKMKKMGLLLLMLTMAPWCHAIETTDHIASQQVIDQLIAGNNRFVHLHKSTIDFVAGERRAPETQEPNAIVLSCIDSRVPPEIIFDQPVGNIFVTRVAANVIDKDVLAGMEYATAVTHAKLIVVMGHENCGAIKGACKNVQLGNLTQLLNKIQPAIQEASTALKTKDCKDKHFIDVAAEDNVKHVVALIPKESPLIRELIAQGKVKIVGAMYHFQTGKVTWVN